MIAAVIKWSAQNVVFVLIGAAIACLAGIYSLTRTPIDAIPDITPVVGYADDLAVLAAAVATVATYITADVKERAAEKLRGWFGA